MTLSPLVIMAALQQAQMYDEPVYIVLPEGRPFIIRKLQPAAVPQWRMYPNGQLEFHAPINDANEYFFETIARGLRLDLQVLANA